MAKGMRVKLNYEVSRDPDTARATGRPIAAEAAPTTENLPAGVCKPRGGYRM